MSAFLSFLSSKSILPPTLFPYPPHGVSHVVLCLSTSTCFPLFFVLVSSLSPQAALHLHYVLYVALFIPARFLRDGNDQRVSDEPETMTGNLIRPLRGSGAMASPDGTT